MVIIILKTLKTKVLIAVILRVSAAVVLWAQNSVWKHKGCVPVWMNRCHTAFMLP